MNAAWSNHRPGAETEQFDEYGDGGQLAAETIRQLGLHSFDETEEKPDAVRGNQLTKVSPPASIESHVYPA